ncbi:MAG: DNA recombination protein RmuC [Microbacteriaceae bacterium]|nr:DNA recombination protein RmuC [Microbacteriaceae bacterium]MCI1207612.1 DNA recombination protein RmuC [Microbacteriaceae bacterium]
MQIWILISLIVGLAVGLLLGVLLGRGRGSHAAMDSNGEELLTRAVHAEAAEAELRQRLTDAQQLLEQQRVDARQQLEALRLEQQARLDAQQNEHAERIAQLSRERAAAEAERVRQAEAEQQNRAKVMAALTPVQEHLRQMQTKISDMELQRQEQYGTLKEQMTQAQKADEMLRDATTQLASALHDNATRGAWGEAQLRNIIESAGLTPHVDFDTQVSITTEDARQRPDLVLHLPGNKSIPVDAKAPFDAYMRASAIPDTASETDLAKRNDFLKAHVAALRKHIDTLASKAYWKLFDSSPEFVVAFIPNESLLSAALENDPTLLEYAFQKRVALASPVTLWAVLKTISYAWQQQELTDQAKQLFDISRELYDRLAVMAEHAEKLRRSIAQTVDNYNRFAGTLEHRVLVTGRKLERIDSAKVIPELTEIDKRPTSLSAPELGITPTAETS